MELRPDWLCLVPSLIRGRKRSSSGATRFWWFWPLWFSRVPADWISSSLATLELIIRDEVIAAAARRSDAATLTQLLTASLNGLSCQLDDPAEKFNLQPEVHQAAICQTHLRDFPRLSSLICSSLTRSRCCRTEAAWRVQTGGTTEELQRAETKPNLNQLQSSHLCWSSEE